MFAPLPAGFSKLEQVIEAMGKIDLVAPKELEDIGVRMRKLYAQARSVGYEGLSRGALRRLPYALWLTGERPLEETDSRLVQAYWDHHLPQALQHPRTAKRWLSPLLYTYCHWFDSRMASFKAFAQRLRFALQLAQGPFSDLMRDFQAQFAWFNPDEVGPRLGRALATDGVPLPQTLERMNLWPGFLDERISSEAFAAVLRLPNNQLEVEAMIQRVLLWSRTGAGDLPVGLARYPEHRIALAEAMVRPWLQKQPGDAIRNRLLSYFVKHYGDPRMLSDVHQGHYWQGVSQPTINVLRRWMVGDTLRGFMRILQLTADDIWRFRERFWMAYYEKGYVEEAWLVLGSTAAWRAQQEFRHSEWAQYGTLSTGATADQSMLFLRIGHLVFMEWSHNGSLRACEQGDPSAPPLYRKEYNGNELRHVVSMDFHRGMNERPQLAHMNSEGGHWQRKARDFIAAQTGVRLNDKDIIG